MKNQKGVIETLAVLGMVAMMGACVGFFLWGGHMVMKDHKTMPEKKMEQKVEPQPTEPKAEESTHEREPLNSSKPQSAD